MKKDKKLLNQINISLTDDDYDVIKTIAFLEQRSISEVARLILVDNAWALYRQRYSHFEKAHFIPGVLPGDDK